MSLWQHKNIHKRHLLWAKLFGICLFFHSLFLFWVFCIYRDNSYMLSISVNKKLDYSAPILFIPLGTPTNNKAKNIALKNPTPQKTAATPTKQAAQKTAPLAAQKKPVTIAAPTPKKPEEKKPIEKQNKTLEEPPKTQKDAPAPAEIKRTVPPCPKTEEIKKEVPKVEQKIEPKKIAPPTENVAGTKTEHIQKPISPVAQALDTEQTIIPLPADTKGLKNTAAIPANAHISHNYREVEALRRGAQLQKELVQQWKPPIGVSPNCMCEISFFVNSTGKIENLKMVKSSGVIMYDISARQALFAMKMPQWTHGKPLIISFKQ